MRIRVVGPGCARCETLHHRVINTLARLDLLADVRQVRDPGCFSQLGIYAMPGLIIGDRVVSQGKLPTEKEIEKWIRLEVCSEE